MPGVQRENLNQEQIPERQPNAKDSEVRIYLPNGKRNIIILLALFNNLYNKKEVIV